MPATPAWPPRSLPRLFVREPLSEARRSSSIAGQANYLGNVHAHEGAGDELLLFDGASGEWLARIAEAGKKRMTLTRRAAHPRAPKPSPTSGSPSRRSSAPQTDWLVEKATELGVGAAASGDDAAHDRRAGQARAAARRSRSRRPSNAGARACRRSPSR